MLCRGNNEDFISRISKYAERKKWPTLLAAFKGALAKVEAELGMGGLDPTTSSSSSVYHSVGTNGTTEVGASEHQKPTKKRKVAVTDAVRSAMLFLSVFTYMLHSPRVCLIMSWLKTHRYKMP